MALNAAFFWYSLAMAGSRDTADRAEASASRASSSYLLYFAAMIAPRAAMFLLLVLLTRLLSAAEYGFFVLVMTTGEILDMGFSNWVRVLLLRTEVGAHRPCPERIGRAFALCAGSTCAAILAAIAITGAVDAQRATELGLAAAAYIAAFATLRLALTMLQIAARHTAFAITEIARAAVLLLATGFAAYVRPSFLPASLALALVTGATALLALAASLHGLDRPVLPRKGYKAALLFGLPLMGSASLFYAVGWWDRYILNYFLGPSSVAIYAAASIARQPVELLIVAMNTYSFPVLVRTHEREGADQVARIQSGVLSASLLLGLAAVCGIAVLAGPLTAVLFPAAYQAEVPALMPWMAFGALCLSIKQFVFDNVFHLKMRYWFHLASMLPAAVFGLALSFLLIRSHGVIGAGLAYAGGAGAAMLASAVLARRLLPTGLSARALAAVVIACGVASATSAAMVHVAAPFGSAAMILSGSLAFAAMYGAVLVCSGFSLRRFLEQPWAAFHADASPASANPRVRTSTEKGP